MKTIGIRLHRTLLTLVVVLFVLAAVAPYNASAQPLAQAGAPVSDDFNRCSLNTDVWTLHKGGNLQAQPTIQGAYTGNSVLSMSLAGNTNHTFSSTNLNAPRIMQSVSDESFEVEVRFTGPLVSNEDDKWHLQGLVFRDRMGTTDQDGGRWLRVEFDTEEGILKYYAAFIYPSGASGNTMQTLVGPTQIVGNASTVDIRTIRVQYVKSTGTWNLWWGVGSAGSTFRELSFTEAELPGAPDFVVSDIGIVAGTTRNPTVGQTTQIDYFRNTAGSFTDDGVVLNIQTAGTGTGTVNRTACNGTTVTLNAVPGSGSSFGGWSGDASGQSPTTTVNMTTSRNVIATFNTGGQTFDHKYYLPVISKN
jgi:hypothetical protein